MNPPNEMGTLFLVTTPIGNLEDMTFRAIRVLKEADWIYCEDTRRTAILLRHFEIEPKAKPLSFHDHSSPSIVQKIRRALMDGQNIAYASDSGMPVVSDPGFVLVRAAQECGAQVTVIPGPSAAVMLFAASALPSPKYLFHGFFPRTRGEVERVVEVMRANPVVHIFYEAPGRIASSVEILSRNMPGSRAVLGRELTKIHEELLHGTLKDLHEDLSARDGIKGECALAVMGGQEEATRAAQPRISTDSIVNPDAIMQGNAAEPEEALTEEQRAEIAVLVKSGVSSKDAAKELSKKFGVSRRLIYEFIIRHLT